jgi:peptidoglycan/xylan/chitin deacetylase (PgdA/CDA1 family)
MRPDSNDHHHHIDADGSHVGGHSAGRGASAIRQSWTRALRPMARRRPAILGYHGIGRSSRREDPFLLSVTPARFRLQLETMLAAGFRFMTVAELAAAAAGRTPPPGLAAVSFDDGMRNNLTVALPILRELGIPATVYVVSGWLGGHSPYVKGAQGALLTAHDLLVLADAGWEIGAHTVTHADLATLDYASCLREIEASCAALERLVGTKVTTLAYPYGRYSEPAIAAVRDAGLSAAVTTGSGSWQPYELTRAMIGAADPLPVVLLKMTDRYEPLLQLRPLRSLRHASRDLRHKLSALPETRP